MNALILWIGIISSATGILTGVIGCVAWYRGVVRKSYAAERDFNHLKRHYEALAEAFKFQTAEMDDRFDRLDKELDNRADRIDAEIREIKAMLLSQIGIRHRERERDG